jgi:hypothetical protein
LDEGNPEPAVAFPLKKREAIVSKEMDYDVQIY